MRKLVAALAAAAILVVPVTAASANETQVSADQTTVGWGGEYGPSRCYVWLEYFKATASVEPIFPFVTLDTEGSVGGHVVCPLPPL